MEIRAVSGFPEWLPELRLAEVKLIDTIRLGFERYGFASVETPAVERLEVLQAKGGAGRQTYQVTRPSADDEADASALGLHFDLTVPLARYVVQHANDLVFPFKRYQIQKVWRGERAQRGRFREFYQADIDVIGRGSLDPLYDAEIPCVIAEVFQGLAFGAFKIHISNRKVLTEFFNSVAPDVDSIALLRIVDRFHKAATDELLQALVNEGLALADAEGVLQLAEAKSLDAARQVMKEFNVSAIGLDELEAVITNAQNLGLRDDQFVVDLSIARGLDYYTGTVFETFVAGKEEWGSICSGGRYDDLASSFGASTGFPGVGISLGLTRLVDLLRAEGLLAVGPSTPALVLVTCLDREQFLAEYLAFARDLRQAGIPTEVFLESKRVADQLAYAAKRGVRLAVIAGAEEIEAGEVTLRDMATREQQRVTRADLVAAVETALRT